MSVINITLSKFDSDWDGGIKNAKKVSSSLSSASDTVLDVVNGLHRDIVYSRNINSDLSRVSKSINEIEDKITDIRTFLLNSARKYLDAQEKISKIHKDYDLPYKKTTWENIKTVAFNIGKATVAVGAAIVAVIGTILIIPEATGAIAVTFAYLGVAFAVNNLISTVTGLLGNEINAMKFGFENFFGAIGNWFGYEELGKNIGQYLYHGTEIVTAIYNLTSLYAELKDAPSVLSNVGRAISNFGANMSNKISHTVTNLKNTMIGIYNSGSSWTSIKQNIINLSRNIGSVSNRGVRSFILSSKSSLLNFITKGKDWITSATTSKSLLNRIGGGISFLEATLSDNTIKNNTSIISSALKFIFPEIGESAYRGLDNIFDVCDNLFEGFSSGKEIFFQK